MRRSLALATVLAALAPAAAQAATTVGSDLTKAATLTPCATPCTAYTGDNTSGVPSAVAPFNGVVVRWRVKTGGAANKLALRALRSADTGSYTGVAASGPQDVAQAGTFTFPARMPVQAGDVIGLDDGSGGAKVAATATSTAVYTFSPPLGSFAHIPSKGTNANRELLVSADIERDADGDGYGDETQDLCPGDPTRHTTCLSNLVTSVTPNPAPLTVGRSLTFTIRVVNEGPSTAQDVDLVVNLPFSATPLALRAGRGYCGGAYTVICHLGPIDKDDQGTVVLTVRPEVVGTLVMTASASTPTDQTSTGDDTSTSDVTVLPPTLRLLNLRLTTPVFHIGGRTAIKWYMTDAAAVNVKLEQISRKGHHLPRGSLLVNGRPGSNAILFKGRLPRQKRLKAGTYRFTVTAATPDGRVAAPAQLSFTVLRTHHR